MIKRYLGIDLGTKRVGLALGDSQSGICSPLKVLASRGNDRDNALLILSEARAFDVTGIVIGLPMNMDGTEGPQCKRSRSLASACRALIEDRSLSYGNIEVHLHDERLTSHAADHLLRQQDLTHKKKKARHDAIAAQILLQSFMNQQELSQD